LYNVRKKEIAKSTKPKLSLKIKTHLKRRAILVYLFVVQIARGGNLMEKEILKEIKSEYVVSEKYIKLLIKICKDNKIHNIKGRIKKYLVCQKGVSNQK